MTLESIRSSGKHFKLGIATVVLLMLNFAFPHAVNAASVTATGRGAIDNNLDAARQVALDDAIKNALLAYGGRVDSQTTLRNGLLSDDRIRFRAAGQVRNVQIITEHAGREFYVVEISADVEPGGHCADQDGRTYSRSVLFTAFPREELQSSLVGKLGNIDADLPLEMSRRLYPKHLTVVQAEHRANLISHSQYLAQSLLASDEVQNIARQHGTQFVVSGSVIDMSMIHPEQYHRRTYGSDTVNRISGALREWRGKDPSDSRNRSFALRVVLSDGLSGQPLFDKVYRGEGIWNARYAAEVGFASPRFWTTDYGRSVSDVIDEAVADLGSKLSCQPFMVNAEALPEANAMYISAGANHGLKVGDSFDIYVQHSVESPGHDASPTGRFKDGASLRMRSEGKTFTVTETYPTYSVGSTSGAVAVGRRYLVVAW